MRICKGVQSRNETPFRNTGFSYRSRGSRGRGQTFMYADLSAEEPICSDDYANAAGSSYIGLTSTEPPGGVQEQVPFSATQLQYLKQLFQQPEQRCLAMTNQHSVFIQCL